MKFVRPRSFAAAAFLAVTAQFGHAAAIVLDLSTTAAPATPLFGADWNGSAIIGDNYGSNFRDFQFNLTAATPVLLSDFTVVVKGDIQQNTLDAAVVGITMWAGPIVPTPVFANSLVTVFTNAAGLPKNGFFDLNLPFGDVVPAAGITTAPEIFTIRVWGTGPSSPEGFKVKLADPVDLLYDPLGSGIVMSNYDGTNVTLASTFTYTGPTPAPTPGPGPAVPEPGTWAMAGLLVLTAGYMRWRRRATASVA
jgi:hypothetical protein